MTRSGGKSTRAKVLSAVIMGMVAQYDIPFEEEGELKTYAAVAKTRKGFPDIGLTRTQATSEAEAREELTRELKLPVMQALYERWVTDGEIVREVY